MSLGSFVSFMNFMSFFLSSNRCFSWEEIVRHEFSPMKKLG